MDSRNISTVLINNYSDEYIVKRANEIVGKLLDHKKNDCPHCDALLREIFGLKDKTSEAEGPATDRTGRANSVVSENGYRKYRF
jgi:hypothetical protein